MPMILSDRTKGNFYLFFVILSSSLESPAFHMHPIRYLNSVVQVLSSYTQGVFDFMLTFVPVPLGFHCHCLLSVRHGQQTTNVSHFKMNVDFLAHTAVSAKWKYKTVAIVLAILMVYLLFAAVECAIQAAKQGGTAYQIMWFSIVVTYGGERKHFYSGI